jgi:hypothetical protein
MAQKLTKRIMYAFLILSVGLTSIIYQSYAKEESMFNKSSITDVKCGFGACAYYSDKCDCSNWQGGYTEDANKKCKCGHKFSDHGDVLSE